MNVSKIGFSGVFVLGTKLLVGCAGSETPTTAERQVMPDRPAPVAAEAPREGDRRGELVRTVATSAATEEQTGVAVWAMYRRGSVVTTFGLDDEGGVRAELGVAAREGGELVVHAPGAGRMRVRADGSIAASDFAPAKAFGLHQMAADLAADTKERPYGTCPYLGFDDVVGSVVACVADDYGYITCDIRRTCDPIFPPFCGIVCPFGTRLDSTVCQCVAEDEPPGWWVY
jgi:hypothetical protein